ncbi:helix-turn-helix domain-containing protein [Carboxylicivirga sp. RSCT41]|uniref:helix-turn-helix domain-containing protein n=1 Tax=Carboxylicivirga agarovorans TaxID=3417570 RepID=UPI003D32588F
MEIESYFDLFLLFGAAFAFLMSMYLVFYPHNLFANRILGVLVFTWAFTVVGYVLGSFGTPRSFFIKYPHFYGVSTSFSLLFFPLMFMYIKSYLYKDARRFRKGIIHYVPSIAYVIIFMPFFLKSGAEKIEMLKHGFSPWIITLQGVLNIVIILQGIFYSILSLRSLHHFQYFRKRKLSKNQVQSVKWLRFFVIANVLLWIIGASGALTEIVDISYPINPFNIFYLGLTLLTIVISVFTIIRPQLFAIEEDVTSLLDEPKAEEDTISDEEKDQRDYDFLLEYFSREKPFLKNDLKMKDLVNGTGLSNKRITDILNLKFDKSFFDLVNEYRTKEAIRLIQEGFHQKHTLPHLAEEAGFNSKTTFNRIFKKYTGHTPSEYIQRNNY